MDEDSDVPRGQDSDDEEEEEEDEEEGEEEVEEEEMWDIPGEEVDGWEYEMFGPPQWEEEELGEQLD